MAPLAVLGATGYAGRLVSADARRSGVPLRPVGRDERKRRLAPLPRLES